MGKPIAQLSSEVIKGKLLITDVQYCHLFISLQLNRGIQSQVTNLKMHWRIEQSRQRNNF